MEENHKYIQSSIMIKTYTILGIYSNKADNRLLLEKIKESAEDTAPSEA